MRAARKRLESQDELAPGFNSGNSPLSSRWRRWARFGQPLP